MSSQTEEDIVAVTPTTMAKVGGGGLMLAGLFMLVLAAQTATMLFFDTVVIATLSAMVLLGGSSLVLGWNVSRMRGWAALSGPIIAAVQCIAALGWLVFSFTHGVFSLLAIAIIPLSGLACVLSGLCIDRCHKADLARGRLRAEGLDVGN
ncbi:MAG: hypothetical protein U0165_14345 [Polyangiaceae bacterium]